MLRIIIETGTDGELTCEKCQGVKKDIKEWESLLSEEGRKFINGKNISEKEIEIFKYLGKYSEYIRKKGFGKLQAYLERMKDMNV